MFLSCTYESFKGAMKEMDVSHVALLFMKAQAHNDRKDFYHDIKRRACIVEQDAIEVAHQVEDALAAGKL